MSEPALKVLAVHTSAASLDVLRAVVEQEGLDLQLAPDEGQALASCQAPDVAVLLLELQPEGGALALARALRADARGRELPIVFISGQPQAQLPDFAGFDSAPVDLVCRPLDARLLRSKLRVLVELHRQRRQHAQQVADQERLQRLTAMMLAALSHDMRTPLTVLALNAELLIRRNEVTGQRIKTATAMLGRQVEHLINLTQLPAGVLQPQLKPGHLGRLLQQRMAEPSNRALLTPSCQVEILGDDEALFDAEMLTGVLDLLLLQAAMRANDAPIRITVDGQGKHTVLLRLQFDTVLNDPARMHLFGGALRMEGVPSPHVGPGLQQAERVVRAHAGSLIGRSKGPEGTTLELMLPRAPLG